MCSVGMWVIKLKMKFILCIFCVIGVCQALVDITVDQAILNSGFHRLVSSNITIYGNLSSCYLVVEEKFPKNFVVYDNDLEDTHKYQVNTRLNTELDVEASARNGSPFSVYLFLNESQPVTTSSEFHTTLTYGIQVHVRYHDPKSGGGYREFKKEPVVLFARCPEGNVLPPAATVAKFPCDSVSDELCTWQSLKVSHKNSLPLLQIPVGDTDQYQLVFLSTHITAYLGAIFIIYMLFATNIH